MFFKFLKTLQFSQGNTCVGGFFKKSLKPRRKAPVLECLLIKLIEKRLQHRCFSVKFARFLTLSRRMPLSYRNQSIDLQSKSVDWFLYNNDLRHERVKNSFLTDHLRRLLSRFAYLEYLCK